jgi:hypothetical protein
MRTLPAAIAAALLLAAPAYGADANFLTAQNYRAHTGPASLVASNYLTDGGGWGDAIVVNQGSNDISYMSGSPFGSLGAPVNKSAPSGPVAVSFGPADVDNDINLAIANRASNSFGFVTDLEDGLFAEQRIAAAGTEPSAVATNYFDIVVANESSDNITYAGGTGFLGWSSANYAAGDGPSGVITTDANGDGLRDVLVSNRNSSNVSMLVAQSNPNPNPDTPAPPVFGPPVNFPAGAAPSDIAIGQFDGTGRADIAVTNETAGTVSVLLATAAGGYAPPVAYRVGSGPTAVATGDVNNDGKTDIVAANSSSNTVSLLQGNGNGTFGAARSFRAHTQPSDVAIFDFNQDGAMDLAVTNAGSNDVSVLLQSPAAIASCHDTALGPKQIVSCGLRVAGYSRSVRAVGRVSSTNGRVTYATAALTINRRANRTSTMRLIPRGTLPNFDKVVISFSIPGAFRRISQYVIVKR